MKKIGKLCRKESNGVSPLYHFLAAALRDEPLTPVVEEPAQYHSTGLFVYTFPD